jgi:hypothetical protein
MNVLDLDVYVDVYLDVYVDVCLNEYFDVSRFCNSSCVSDSYFCIFSVYRLIYDDWGWALID